MSLLGRIPSMFCDHSAAQCDCLCEHKLPVVVGVVLMLQQMVYRWQVDHAILHTIGRWQVAVAIMLMLQLVVDRWLDIPCLCISKWLTGGICDSVHATAADWHMAFVVAFMLQWVVDRWHFVIPFMLRQVVGRWLVWWCSNDVTCLQFTNTSCTSAHQPSFKVMLFII